MMTHWKLTQLATRNCGHDTGMVCACPRKVPSATVQAYLDKAKRRLPQAILYNPEWVPDKPYGDRYRIVEFPTTGLRLVGTAYEVARKEGFRLDATGYYVDEHQDELAVGEVYQLPACKGKPQYVPAVHDPWNDAAIIDFHSVTDDIRDAVRWADSMADKYAEESRECYRKDQAEQRIEEIDTEITELYEGVKALARELRSNCDKLTGLTEVRKLIRREVTNTRAAIAKLRRERDEQAELI
jgi:hypothetical protein